MSVFSFFLLLLFSATIMAGHRRAPISVANLKTDTTWLRQELGRMHLPKDFIRDALKSYDKNSFAKVLQLNLLGFLHPPQHMDLVTDQAVRQCRVFLNQQDLAFQKAQKKYAVSPSVISALLWVETKHGHDSGHFHVLSVYLDLLQTNLPRKRKKLTKLALEKNIEFGRFSDRELKKLMHERTKKRTQWAQEQIRALAVIYRKKQMNLKTLEGSFAGAFGLSQFIPSSYQEYARAAKPGLSANLYKPADAIMSVAHYLKKSGWQESRASTQVTALMKYNNSQDYAESILELAQRMLSTRVANQNSK